MISDIPDSSGFETIPVDSTGMVNLFGLQQWTKGNIGWYTLLYILFLQMPPTGN